MRGFGHELRRTSGRSKPWRTLFSAAIVALAACGGSGSDGITTAPSAPSLTLTAQAIKTFHFSWADASGETEYRLLENPDGVSGFSQIATLAADAVSHDLVVSLPARINASYMLEACNSIGCTGSNIVSIGGNVAEAVGYIKASNTGLNDMFGYALALSADGNTLAVGAWGEASNATGISGNQNDNSAINSGAVYVFTRSDTAWSQQAYLKSSNSEEFDWFGFALTLSADGNTLAVGALQEDSNATGIGGDQDNNLVPGSGAVYIFTRNDITWNQQAYLKASNTRLGNILFGWALALSANGSILAVGAGGEASNATGIDGNQDDISASVSGAVYIFTRNDTIWSQQAYLKASNAAAFDQFGSAVALSDDGSTLAVGALQEDSNATGIDGDQTEDSALASGAVYLFIRNDTIWSQQAYLKASNTGVDDRFGSALALSADGDTLAVGAWGEASNAIGADGDQADDSMPDSGAVYLFARSNDTWSQQTYLKASNTGMNNGFGSAVALSADGNTLAVGATGETSNATNIDGNQTDDSMPGSGAVYLFVRSDDTWNQRAYLKASNTGADDRFGSAIALSAVGSMLAVGAPFEDSNATDIGGNQTDNSLNDSGAVYLF